MSKTNQNILKDRHGRTLNYLRLAVTDRCNLRCFYCMPEEGIQFTDRENLLSYEEMLRLLRITASMGVNKVRITGGEPFVRKNMVDFMHNVSRLEGIDTLNLTTNGTMSADIVPELKKMGIKSVNLSLDSLDRDRFFEITRRDLFDKVMQTLDKLLEYNIQVKINAVVMDGRNIEDLIPLVQLTKNQPINVRFIEEMPFNGTGRQYEEFKWNHKAIEQYLRDNLPEMTALPFIPTATANEFNIKGHQGKVGIIAAYTRSFCGTCNRLRVTPQGTLKTCLYDNGVFNIKDFLRAGATDDEMRKLFQEAVAGKAKDGFEAEAKRGKVFESMTSIGG